MRISIETGWVTDADEVLIPHFEGTLYINNSAANAQAYKLDIWEDKFSRKNFNPIAGSYSMHCGLTTTEASASNWPGSTGYGNEWEEAIRWNFFHVDFIIRQIR